MDLDQDQLGELRQALAGLRAAVPKVKRLLVATSDGLPLVDDAATDEADTTTAAAITAATVGLGKRGASMLGHGPLAEIVIRTSDGYLVVYAVGDSGVLAAFGAAGLNLGLLHLDARPAAAAIEAILPSSAF